MIQKRKASHKCTTVILFVILMLIFCLWFFCPEANALYNVYNTGNSDVYGLSGVEVQPAIGSEFGTVSAIANYDYAYGLYGNGGNVEISGDFGVDGIIYAEAGNDYAYGLYSNSSIITGDINGTITAEAGNNYAYCLRSLSDSITTGAIDGTITATAAYDYASGLGSSKSITTGDIGGTIIVRAGNDFASGLYCSTDSLAPGALTTGAISGTIIAEATNHSVYGLCSVNGSITTGDIDGTITAIAGTNGASGLECNDSITTGDINGTITVTAGTNRAVGLRNYNDPMTIGDINGTITVTAGTYSAVGFYSGYGPLTTDDINGTITVQAGDDNAVGLYNAYTSITTGSIRGTISANAGGDFAYGILSYGPMDVIVDGGIVSAVAGTGSNVAAIQSGKNLSNPVKIQDADDTVEIVAGSTIIGDIDLGMYGTDQDILTLSGVNANSTALDYDIKNIETINITGGQWYINGTIYNSTNGIEMIGGILSGTGTLGSLSVVSGILAPGSSIGTTAIDGDLSMYPGSTLEIEIDNSGNSDKLIVTGNVDITGGTVKTISTETITDSQEYTIVNAQSVVGKFDAIDTALLNTTLSNAVVGADYQADSILLKIFPRRFDDSDIMLTSNQIALGSALQQIADGGGNSITTALQQLVNPNEVRGAYDQLSGQSRPSLAPITTAGTTIFTGAVSDRLHNTHGDMSHRLSHGSLLVMAGPVDPIGMSTAFNLIPVGPAFILGNNTDTFADQRWGFWGKGYGAFGDREAESGAPGYQYTVYGTSFGLDYQCTNRLLLGITSGYSDGNVDYFSSRDKSDVFSIPIGLYGSYNINNWYFDGILSYARLEYTTERYVELTAETLSGEFDGDEMSGYFEGGFNWRYNEDCLIRPLASFQFSRLNLESYTESGGASSLGYNNQSYESHKGSLGVKLTKQLSESTDTLNASIEFRGRWVHEFSDTRSHIDAHFASDPGIVFAVNDEDISRDSVAVGIGFRGKFGNRTSLTVDYDASLNADQTSHIVSAGLEHRW